MAALAVCGLYTATVLLMTVTWMYVGRKWSFSALAYAMYFPTVGCVFFVDKYDTFLTTAIGYHTVKDSAIFSGIAALAVLQLVGAVAVLDLILGWAVPHPPSAETGVHAHNKSTIGGFVKAAGEEIGWRSFLLPCLMSHFNPGVALLISGICWGLFHVPVMVLLTKRLNVPHPVLTILVQCLSCVLCAFPHGWVAIKSGYSLWASTVMHYTWNKINPVILGSIYTQKPGMLVGKQWLINGEGFAGCLVMLPVAILVTYSL